jgi:plasmid stabilization system protein ParE
MAYSVIFAPEALEQLTRLYRYIAVEASAESARNFTDGIVDYCESLSLFPLRGQCRKDIRPGLRTTNYKKRTIIAFTVTETQVSILGIYYGGQNFEDRLCIALGP